MKTFCVILLSCVAHCQLASGSPDDRLASFDVVSVKASPPPGQRVIQGMWGGPGSKDPTTVRAENFSISNMITVAFDLPGEYQMSAPSWTQFAKFDIVAKLPAGTTQEAFRSMWRNLLIDRFQLTFHHETREVPGYDLVIAKDRHHRLTPSAGTGSGAEAKEISDNSSADKALAQANTLDKAGFPVVSKNSGRSEVGIRGRNRANYENMPMNEFAVALGAKLHRPVADRTGLKDRFTFSLFWVSDCFGCGDTNSDLPQRPMLVEAVEQQLGLKLQASKVPFDLLVIDSVSKHPHQIERLKALMPVFYVYALTDMPEAQRPDMYSPMSCG